MNGVARAAAVIALSCVAASARAQGVPSYVVHAGESRAGDAYILSGHAEVAGVHDGDLTIATQTLTITGQVTGDIHVAGQTVILAGVVGDSVRACVKTINVTGTVDGDLLAVGGNIVIGEGGHVTGNVMAAGSQIAINGVVDGRVKATGGQLSVAGRIGKDARLTSDSLEIDPRARIAGDLTYTSRTPLDIEGRGIVGGRIAYEAREEEEEEQAQAFLTGGRVLRRLWLWSAFVAVGLVFVRVFRAVASSMADAVARDTLLGVGLGFGLAVVVPVVAFIVVLLSLFVLLPLALIVWMLIAVGVYLAKIPVAMWIGRALLRAAGGTGGRGYLALVIGALLLYVVFLVPYLGTIVWFACVFLGLGAIVLGARAHLVRRTETPAAPVLGSTAPAMLPI